MAIPPPGWSIQNVVFRMRRMISDSAGREKGKIDGEDPPGLLPPAGVAVLLGSVAGGGARPAFFRLRQADLGAESGGARLLVDEVAGGAVFSLLLAEYVHPVEVLPQPRVPEVRPHVEILVLGDRPRVALQACGELLRQVEELLLRREPGERLPVVHRAGGEGDGQQG